MIPSRGLRLARWQVPRSQNIQCRNLSSTSNRILSTRILSPSTIKSSPSRTWRPCAPFSISAIPAVRYASTLPASPPASVTPPTPDPSSLPNLDTITLDNIDLDTATQVTEKIGFLKELGLDYGYGMTTTLQYLVEHLHCSADLPWWASIVATGVIVRLGLFWFVKRSSDVTARQAAMAPVMAPLMEEMNAAKASGENERVAIAWKKMSTVRKQAGISFTAQLTPMFAQAWIGYCGYRLMRAMATLPVPGLDEGGFLWLTDLTLSDPFLILPAAMGLSVHLLIRLGGESGAANTDVMGANMKNFMMYGMPGAIALITAWQPAAVGLWFAASGAMGIGQSLLLQRPGVRKFLNIAPIYKPSKEEAAKSSMASWMKENFKGDLDKRAPSKSSKASASKATASGPVYQAPAPKLRTRPSNYKGSQVIDVQSRGRSN